MEDVKSSLEDADVIILIIDANEDPFAQSLLNQEFVKEKVFKSKKSKLLVLNKIDLIKQEKVTELIKHFEEQKLFEEVIPISASQNFNIQRVKEEIIRFLPEGQKLFPDDQITDASERYFVSELIREKILEIYNKKIDRDFQYHLIDIKYHSYLELQYH